MNYVADKLDLKKDIQFSTVVQSAVGPRAIFMEVSTNSGQKRVPVSSFLHWDVISP